MNPTDTVRSQANLPSRADAVVIGGGIIGSSVAYFLAKAGFGHVVLLEKAELASGATRHSAAHVRLHYSTEIGIRLALRALEMFRNAEEEFGARVPFTQTGYLVIAAEESREGVAANVDLQRRLGVETELMRPGEIAERWPELQFDGIAIGAFEPGAGYADPVATVTAIAASAARLGVDVHRHLQARAIEVRDGAVESVVTDHGRVRAPIVVNAAGPWANQIAAMVGGSYSLRLSREEEALFVLPQETTSLPIVSDAPGGVYFRPAGSRQLLVGLGYPKELQPCDPDAFDDEADQETVRHMAGLVVRRYPKAAALLDGLEGATVGRFAGVYSITDDWYPIVGPSLWADGLFEAVGGSGHSFKLGPPLGEALADVIAGRDPTIDISALNHRRFGTGDPFHSIWGPGNRA